MTLPEVLVALALLAGVSLGIMAFLGTSLRFNKLALDRSIATGLASDRVEQVTSTPFQPQTESSNYGLPGEDCTGCDASATVTFEADYGDVPEHPRFKRTTTIEYDVPLISMVRVQVDVTWEDLKQGEKTHTMITLLHPDLEKLQ